MDKMDRKTFMGDALTKEYSMAINIMQDLDSLLERMNRLNGFRFVEDAYENVRKAHGDLQDYRDFIGAYKEDN